MAMIFSFMFGQERSECVSVNSPINRRTRLLSWNYTRRKRGMFTLSSIHNFKIESCSHGRCGVLDFTNCGPARIVRLHLKIIHNFFSNFGFLLLLRMFRCRKLHSSAKTPRCRVRGPLRCSQHTRFISRAFFHHHYTVTIYLLHHIIFQDTPR